MLADLTQLMQQRSNWPRHWRAHLIDSTSLFIAVAISPDSGSKEPIAWVRMFHATGICCVWAGEYSGEPVTVDNLERAIVAVQIAKQLKR